MSHSLPDKGNLDPSLYAQLINLLQRSMVGGLGWQGGRSGMCGCGM